ncbi:VQ motif-containing protein 31-like [Cynara cardunculus var. scolymus]|uniref:VQ-like protein n=1 Tax=Cynara cardunculus var. scolymus TaxID=59895 RepID=A0A124SGD6_CYNCS|nr:VQ motif-containing protein 31-like [Cynara cardunculus var. scolymus]KVI06058.1 VQ-like protein [Cynara cardunculus var. scolymus]
MASFFNGNNVEVFGPNSKPATTFVQTDPSNFRAVVQRLTGATTLYQPSASAYKLPISTPSHHAGKPTFTEIGRRRSGYKLHERRKTIRKLEISVENVARRPLMSPAARKRSVRADGEMVVASPVSTLDVCGGEGSCPGTPMEEEEEKAIAEKGFYLHPSPKRGSEPKLLVLFPLNSPINDPSYSP